MKDCGEDLLVDISEILFNELAFFRLMQDLDSSHGAKHKGQKPEERPSRTRQAGKVRLASPPRTIEAENKSDVILDVHPLLKSNAAAGGEKSVSPACADEDNSFIPDQDEATEGANGTLQEFYYQSEKKSSRSEGSEEEAEGRAERLPLSIGTSGASSAMFVPEPS